MSDTYECVWLSDGSPAFINNKTRQMFSQPQFVAQEMNRLSEKIRVYIVFKEVPSSYTGNEFVGVFFTRENAETWIQGRRFPRVYFIESYEQPEDGMAEEVFD